MFLDSRTIPLADWVNSGIDWVVANYGDSSEALANSLLFVLVSLEQFLRNLPWWLVVLVVAFIGWHARRPPGTLSGLLGRSLRRLREFHRHRMSMVFQHFGLFPHRTVVRNVAYGLELRASNRPPGKRAPGSGSKPWASRATSRAIRSSCPAVCSSGWGWPGPWPRTRTSCSWTRPSAPWTR